MDAKAGKATIKNSADLMASKKRAPIITERNINELRDVDVLIINGHGNGNVIAGGLSGDEMADFLIANKINPKAIDVATCCRAPGPARQDLANRMNVPVRGTKGRTFTDEDGNERIIDEAKTSESGEYVIYPQGAGYEIFNPEKE